jgi:UDP-GlcNAc:undecaprenyl-phosphate GlcNAc-1-phosphate transferase
MDWIPLAVSLTVALAVVPAGVSALESAGVRRANFRGREVVFPLGGVVLASSAAALVALAILDRALLDPAIGRWLPYVFGVALLGLIDDAFGGGNEGPRGWLGHGRALLAGEISTGQAKAVGTLALAAFTASTLDAHAPGYALDVVVLTLAPHVGNLLDLRPGRVEKAAALTAAGMCTLTLSVAPLLLLGPMLGPVAVGSRFTLGERAMLGDSGASLIGAMIGIWLVTAMSPTALVPALAALIGITIYGELRSISDAIERASMLRRLDALGRAG